MDRPLRCPLEIPVLETERLRLRGHTLEDFEHTRAMWGDLSVMQYMGGVQRTTEDSWARFLRYAGHWHFLGFGYWVVEEKDTQEFVGEVGFADYKRDLEPPLEGIPELGWTLTPTKHGKGYATEAAKAAMQWAQNYFGSSRFTCLIHPDNRASMKVAAKCGFEPKRSGFYKGRPNIVLETSR